MGALLVALAAAGLLHLMDLTATAQAHPMERPVSAEEIAQTVRGRICATRAGTKFSFGADGSLAYDGLWQSRGNYLVAKSAVVVTFRQRPATLLRHLDARRRHLHGTDPRHLPHGPMTGRGTARLRRPARRPHSGELPILPTI